MSVPSTSAHSEIEKPYRKISSKGPFEAQLPDDTAADYNDRGQYVHVSKS